MVVMWFRVLLTGILLLPAAAGAESRAASPQRRSDGLPSALPVATSLRPQVEFWKKVFATYGDNQVVIHDSEDLGRIYRVLDFSDLAQSGLGASEIQRVREEQVATEKEYVRAALIRVHQSAGDPSSLDDAERKMLRLFRDAPPGAILEAAQIDRIRAQRGIKERFSRGISVSRRYALELERIFREEGVPEEVTRLALVESCFNVQAYSKVGAAGVWQFMPGTGRLYMRVDDVIDERRDPLIAGRAAARFLRRNYERLGTWPLAITAYNHGPNGMAKAVDALGTDDIATIIRSYRGPLFGFASRNFYPEFVAAWEIDHRYADHFPDLEVQRPIATEWVEFPNGVRLETAIQVTGLERETLLDLNPALGASIRAERAAIPEGYGLRVPLGRAERARAGYDGLPAAQRAASAPVREAKPRPSQKRGNAYVVHKVRKGQTLTQIAKRYGTTVGAIKVANRIGQGSIRAGQTLKVPTG